MKPPLGNSYLHILTKFQINRTFLASVVQKLTLIPFSPSGWTFQLWRSISRKVKQFSRWFLCQMFSQLSAVFLPSFRQKAQKMNKKSGSHICSVKPIKIGFLMKIWPPFSQKFELWGENENTPSKKIIYTFSPSFSSIGPS